MNSWKLVSILGSLLVACCNYSQGMFPPFPENPSNQQREDGPLRHRKPFYPKEDERLRALVGEGTNDWRAIAQQMPGRNARQCRERWTQYLVPDRTQSPWTLTEEQILLAKYREFGAKWIEISQFLQGRSANDVKYRFLRIRLDANARNEWRYRVACLDDNRSRKGNSDTVPSVGRDSSSAGPSLESKVVSAAQGGEDQLQGVFDNFPGFLDRDFNLFDDF